MVVCPRNQSDVWAKRMEVTQPGVAALRRALPIAVDVQQRLFGERPSRWQPADSTPEPRQRTFRGNEASISQRRTGLGSQVNVRFRDAGVELRTSLMGAKRQGLADSGPAGLAKAAAVSGRRPFDFDPDSYSLMRPKPLPQMSRQG